MTISREAIDEFYADNKRRGESLDGEMLWGYFFTHHDGDELEDMQPILEALGYTYVGILEPEDGDDDSDLLLHVERVEKHSPASLFKRCRELSELAEKHGLDGFDGFDVGYVDGDLEE